MTLTETDIRDAISKAIPEYQIASITAEDDFKRAGIDSLDHVMILLTLQESYGLHVPDETINQLSTIRAIVAYATALPDKRTDHETMDSSRATKRGMS